MKTSRRQFLKLVAGSAVALGALGARAQLRLFEASAASHELCVVAWDGVERSILYPLLPSLPNLSQLNIYDLACVTQAGSGKAIPTETTPQFSIALTGRDCTEWGTRNNLTWQPIPPGLTIFEYFRATFGSDIYLAAYEGKKRPGSAVWSDSAVASLDDFFPADRVWGFTSPTQITNKVLAKLSDTAGQRRLIYSHHNEPDGVGHSHGFDTPQYQNTIIDLDQELGRLRSAFPDIPVMVFADHGFGQGGDPLRHNLSPSTFLATTWPIEDRAYNMAEIYAIIQAAITGDPGGGSPDLRVVSMKNPPASVSAGGTFDVSETTKNIGNAPAGPSVNRYYLSQNTTKDGADILLGGSRSVPGLAPGQQSWGRVTVTVPVDAPLGTYYLLASADDDGLLAESNETNNVRASSSTIQVSS